MILNVKNSFLIDGGKISIGSINAKGLGNVKKRVNLYKWITENPTNTTRDLQ